MFRLVAIKDDQLGTVKESVSVSDDVFEPLLRSKLINEITKLSEFEDYGQENKAKILTNILQMVYRISQLNSVPFVFYNTSHYVEKFKANRVAIEKEKNNEVF